MDARAHTRAAIERLVRLDRRMLLAAALLSLAAGLALREASTGRSPASSRVAAAHALPVRGMVALPATLRGPVSAAMGADDPAYLVTPRSGGRLAARTPAEHLSSSFGASGVTVRSATARLSLGLRAVGFGTALVPLAPVAPSAHANHVLYSRSGLAEWYTNGPLGLEQGFTIARPPAGRPAGPLTLELSLSTSAPPVLARGAKSFTVGPPGPGSVGYSGLTAVDARGHVLPSSLQIRGGHLLIQLDAAHAAYPVKVDPFLQQGPALTGSGESGNGRFGASVALSADGNTALVGGWRDAEEAGAAWVFTRSGEAWTQQGSKLTGSGGVGKERFGASVALSGDGNTALIGGDRDNAFEGAAWAFIRESGVWSQQGGKLTPSDETGEGGFGTSVALSGDGNTALIGASEDNTVGAAWAFVRSEGGVWSQQGSKLTGTGAAKFPEFGISVALSSDGNTALVGGSGDNGSAGAVWPFHRTGGAWAQQGSKLTGSGESGAGRFGESVALSSDGNAAVIGGGGDSHNSGAAWAFTRSGGVWSQQGAKLIGAGEGTEEEFGDSVASSADGTTALVGARFSHIGAGTAYVLTSGPHAPSVVTGEPSSETASSAVLNATVNPNGQNVTACQFEYGPSIAYEESVPCETLPGAGEAPVAVSANVTGLTIQLYHYRISATNATGTNHGADRTFTPKAGPGPTVTKLSVKKGPASGDTAVTITGTNFIAPVTVKFGASEATAPTLNSSTSISVKSPPGTAGSAPVTVTTPNGTSAPASKTAFKYGNPTVESVSPSSGPAAGGTTVTVKGSGFALGSATTFLFKKTAGKSASCSSTSECTVTSPAGTGTVDVIASVAGKKSKKNPGPDSYEYK
ncbi:MAG TPA: IPT/TIG domain-containing protein [Solirubrobacteraceae bacterium]|nr:IPT/TIG domain-containing protein [Solirubrobacteraceae bacterium]